MPTAIATVLALARGAESIMPSLLFLPPVPEASSARVFASLWTFDPGSFAEFRTLMSPEAEAKPGADAQPLGEGMDVAEVRRALKIG
jgi:hypothetical protein